MKNNNFTIAALVSLFATVALCFAWCASGIGAIGGITLVLGAGVAACTAFSVLPRCNEGEGVVLRLFSGCESNLFSLQGGRC